MFQNFLNRFVDFGRKTGHTIRDLLRHEPWFVVAAVALVLLLR